MGSGLNAFKLGAASVHVQGFNAFACNVVNGVDFERAVWVRRYRYGAGRQGDGIRIRCAADFASLRCFGRENMRFDGHAWG